MQQSKSYLATGSGNGVIQLFNPSSCMVEKQFTAHVTTIRGIDWAGNNVWYGMVWYGKAWYGMVWYGMVWYGMVWYGMVWYGMVWYGMVWYGMVWYGMGKPHHLTHLPRCSQRRSSLYRVLKKAIHPWSRRGRMHCAPDD